MASRAPEPLPKAGSGAFKALHERVLKVLDLPRLVLVLEGALDRKSLEEILRKLMRGGALRPGAIPRHELVAAVAEAFTTRPESAWLTVRALDKSSSKERHIVASIDDGSVHARLSSYRALDFRRERARLVWALVRDGREGHVEAAERILTEAFHSIEAAQEVEQALEDKGGASHEHLDAIKERLETYEAALREQGEVLQREKGERESIERERSELLVKLGMRERALNEEQRQRRATEDELKRLRLEVRTLKAELERLDPERVRDALLERDRLRERARSLERQTDRLERLAELSEENAALKAEIEERRRSEEQWRTEHEHLVRQLVSRERAAHERVSSLRESLKTARKLAATPSDPSVVEGEPVSERVGVFIDASNLAASARREHGGKFDFLTLLPEVVGARRRVAAVAFVVNNDDGERGEGGFAGFVRSLQAAGYEVRQKRPRVRADGSRKADWDMGIAMEIIDARNRLDVVVLGSGDGDFLPLVARLKRWNKRVEVAAYRGSTDAELIRAADEFIPLDGRFAMGE